MGVIVTEPFARINLENFYFTPLPFRVHAKNKSFADNLKGRGLRPALAGILIGAAGALVLNGVTSRVSCDVVGLEPVTFAGVCLLLLGCAPVAGCARARRASLVDTMVVRREE